MSSVVKRQGGGALKGGEGGPKKCHALPTTRKMLDPIKESSDGKDIPDLAKHTHMRRTAFCRHWRQCGQRCANLATAYKHDQAIRARKPPIYMTQGLLKQWLFKSKSPQSTAEDNGVRISSWLREARSGGEGRNQGGGHHVETLLL